MGYIHDASLMDDIQPLIAEITGISITNLLDAWIVDERRKNECGKR